MFCEFPTSTVRPSPLRSFGNRLAVGISRDRPGTWCAAYRNILSGVTEGVPHFVQFHNYNSVHPVLKRLNIASFLVAPPVGAPVDALSGVIAAEQVQLYAVHNMRLNDPELDVDYNPAGYRAFANFLNQYDKPSGFYWSYWSDVERRIKDPESIRQALWVLLVVLERC
ncbi:hypothetical protein B0H12DRAFT_1076622 [Mycena haematopus]|nr:hypothetical protein B0H12DRAFT_1076622 [Mycena haematopus]